MLLELFWKLLYRSHKRYFRVYRVLEDRDGIVLRSIVYDNIEHKRFVQKYSFSSELVFDDCEITDLSDAWNAINGLQDVPFLMDKGIWLDHGAESIDEAIRNADALVEEFRQHKTSLAATRGGREEARRAKLRARATMKESAFEAIPHDHDLHVLSKALWKKARTKRVSWMPGESISGERQCQVLTIDGRSQHLVP
jgi:hypothetical protein